MEEWDKRDGEEWGDHQRDNIDAVRDLAAVWGRNSGRSWVQQQYENGHHDHH
ncbi:MAG TPA: hypothetical protein VEG32_10460 [Clostridia bacterium]|nr:hypothetical protein [Clostridia bacterium]